MHLEICEKGVGTRLGVFVSAREKGSLDFDFLGFARFQPTLANVEGKRVSMGNCLLSFTTLQDVTSLQTTGDVCPSFPQYRL